MCAAQSSRWLSWRRLPLPHLRRSRSESTQVATSGASSSTVRSRTVKRWGGGALAVALVAGLVGWAISAVEPSASAADAPVSMGTASTYAVLAGSTVTNTGNSVLNGDLGLSPGSAVTGFPPGAVNGATNVDNAAAVQAQSDLTTAYNDAAGRASTATISSDLGGQTLVSGVYTGGALGLTGTLTLDAQGDSTRSSSSRPARR